MVRNYILTDTEIAIARAYVDHDEKLPGFAMLKLRLRRLEPKLWRLFEQLEYVQDFLEQLRRDGK